MREKNAIRTGLFGLGFISISTQIFLLRESYVVFYGNELILGIMLSAWMLLTGTGAWIGRWFPGIKDQGRFVLFLMLILSALPVLMIIKLNLYRAILLPAGTIAGIRDVVYAAFLVLLPFCIINGFLFSALSSMLGKASLSVKPGDEKSYGMKHDATQDSPEYHVSAGRKAPGNAYFLESFGSMAAGTLVNFILLWLFPSWQSELFITGLYLLSVVVFAFYFKGRYIPWITILISALIMFLLISADIRGISYYSRYPGQTVIEDKETPYGQLVVTCNSGQINCYENGLLLFSSGDEINNEENVHYAMVQHASPRHVLLVSGGLSGAINEILKYNPLTVDYVELNPALLKIGMRSLTRLEKKSVFLHSGDARRFIKASEKKYDVVLILLPPPSTLQLNRIYTAEFISELKTRMSDEAIVSFALPTTSDYVSKAGEGLNSILWQTLRSSFRNILIVPGGKTYFIASDGNLNLDIPDLIEKRGIPTSYVNKYYLDAGQMKERADYMRAGISEKAEINYDFRPAMFFAQLKYWMSYFNQHYYFALLTGLLVIIFILMNLNPVNLGLFTGGVTAGSFQVILILSLQIFCGYVFQLTGFIVMLFMLGLALGSYSGTRWFFKTPFKTYMSAQIAIAALSILIPLILITMGRCGTPLWVIQAVIAGMTLVLSFLIGMEYSLASHFYIKKPSSIVAKNYSADLFGSALGAFAVPVFLFPLIGMMNTGLILAFMNTFSAFFLFMRRKNFVSL